MAADYDPRYLAGVLLFNRHDFFEAHDAWEEYWTELAGPDRRFVQGLIQAAVGLVHFGNGNLRGAVKLYHSSRDYMTPLEKPHLGLDREGFWRGMERCFAVALVAPEAQPRPELDLSLVPTIELVPPPNAWPDPAEFLEAEEEGS